MTLVGATNVVEDTVAALSGGEDREGSEAMMDALEVAVVQVEGFRWFAIIGAFTIMLRFFKAFDSQPRLSLVSRTLSGCLIDVAHFLFVMAAIFTVFSIAAVVLFGHRVARFVTVSKAIRTCLFVLMGEFDWEEMQVIGDDLAFGWLFLFFFLIVLLSLNMLLAIVFDTYNTVREDIPHDCETLWSQSYEIGRRLWNLARGRRVSLNHIDRSIRSASARPKLN